MDNKRVSIITASYNYEGYIKETIESVINQTFQDWEMIIVDDGSTDNSVEIIRSYCEKDKRIKLYKHENGENKGLAETLKLGIEKAQSDWIAFLESDDTITPDYLSEKFSIVSKYENTDFIFNDVNMFGEQEIINKYKRGYLPKILPVVSKLTYPTKMLNTFRKTENDNIIPTFSVVMLRKKVLEGIDFNSPIMPYLDWYVWLQIVGRKNCEFYYIDKQLTNWRMHKHSYISTMSNEKEQFIFEIKKNIFLFDYSRLFKTIKKIFKLLRRLIIRVRFNDGEVVLFGKEYQVPILPQIYSKNNAGDKVKYKIFGIEISIKPRNKIKKFNINEIRNKIKEKIQSNSLEYVSFDIFDTLLVRPCINPTDIFALLAQKVDSEYGIDFYSMRINAEQESKVKNANIYAIYDFIKSKYNLSEELKTSLLKEEIAIETQLLSVREDLKEIYDLAVKSGKKIIATSDMYLPSSILMDILKKNNFNNIEKVYVSNEYNARKDDGSLFEIVLDDIKTTNIIHIGDNYRSDYLIPKKKKIAAFYYPKVTEILRNYNKLFNDLIYSCSFKNRNKEIINKSIFIGFVINNYWFNLSKNNSKSFNSISDFINLFLAPYIFFITHCIQNNPIIQKTYNKIYFVSRDGYFPNIMYTMLNKGKYIPSQYIYGSRIAYWTGTYNSIKDLLNNRYFTSKYTFEDFLNAYIADRQLLKNIKQKYSQNELKIKIKHNIQNCIELIHKQQEAFDNYYKEQKILAKKYYETIFNNEKDRVVVFDVGYNGSISTGISKLSSKIIDKIYVHETSKNIYRDNKNRTYTYILKNGIQSNIYSSLDLLLEELFSPLEGTCIGFKNDLDNIEPVLEELNVPPEMQEAHKEIQNTVEHFSQQLLNIFGEYLQYINIVDINCLFDFVLKNFKHCPKEKQIFDSIVYNDIAFRHNQVSLKNKIS